MKKGAGFRACSLLIKKQATGIRHQAPSEILARLAFCNVLF